MLTNVSDKMLLVGLIWYVTVTGGKSLLTLFISISLLPHLFMVLKTGKLINKMGALKLIIASDLFRSILYSIMAIYIILCQGKINVIVLVASTFLANIAAALFNPALLTLPIKLVSGRGLQKLTALLSSTISIATIVGPMMAVYFYKVSGLYSLFLCATISYGIAGLIELTIKIVKQCNDNIQPNQTSLSLIVKVKNYSLIVRMLVLFFLMNIFMGPLQLFMPLYAKVIFHGSVNTLSHLEVALGIGALLGMILMSAYTFKCRLWLRIILPYLLMAIAYFFFASSYSLFTAFIALSAMGFFLAIGNVSTLNLFQTYPAITDIPAIMAMVNFISVAATPLAIFIAGNLLNEDYLQEQAQLYAIAVFVLGLAIYFIPSLRQIKVIEASTHE